MKVDFDSDLDPDGLTVLHGRFKLPGFHGFDSILVKPHAYALHYANMTRVPILFYYQTKRADSLVVRFASLLVVYGFRCVDSSWWCNPPTHVKHSTGCAYSGW